MPRPPGPGTIPGWKDQTKKIRQTNGENRGCNPGKYRKHIGDNHKQNSMEKLILIDD